MRSLAILGVLLLGCASSSSGTGTASNRVALDATALCDKIINECKQAIAPATCDLALAPMRVSPECASKLASGTCEVLTSSLDGSDEECFPSCTTPGSQSCNGDGTMTGCTSKSRTVVFDCEATCQKVSNPPKSWSGTCGTSYQGQSSSDGEEKCWCQ